MEIILIAIFTILATTSKAQMQVEVHLKVNPILKIHVSKTIEMFVQSDKNLEFKLITFNEDRENFVDLGVADLALKASGEATQQSFKFATPTTKDTDGNFQHAEVNSLLELAVSETTNDSSFLLKYNSSFGIESHVSDVESQPLDSNPLEKPFEKRVFEKHTQSLSKVKISGKILINYMVPENIRRLQIITGEFSGLMSNAQTIGFENTLSDELEARGDKSRPAFVMPLSIISQTIEIPEQDFTSVEAANFNLTTLIKRNLHLQGAP